MYDDYGEAGALEQARCRGPCQQMQHGNAAGGLTRDRRLPHIAAECGFAPPPLQYGELVEEPAIAGRGVARGIERRMAKEPEPPRTAVQAHPEIIENEKLVGTIVLEPDYCPARQSPDALGSGDEIAASSGAITLEPHGVGRKHTAIAMDRDEAGRETHERMGARTRPSSSSSPRSDLLVPVQNYMACGAFCRVACSSSRPMNVNRMSDRHATRRP